GELLAEGGERDPDCRGSAVTFRAGTTVWFGFTLDSPAVRVCDFGGASGGPCDHAFGAAMSAFSATIWSEPLHQESPARRKTQGWLPSEESALVLLFSLVASGQIRWHRIDGRRRIATVLRQICAGGGVTGSPPRL